MSEQRSTPLPRVHAPARDGVSSIEPAGRPAQRGRSIFLSYRRADTAGYAGRIYDRLAARFGATNVLMDVTDITPGTDFVDRIRHMLEGCAAVIVLIGPGWAGSNPNGGRRIDDENDFVRLEVVHALRHDVTLIPVLIRDAQMPPESTLPAPLKPLARRNALELDDGRWEYDIARLIGVLDSLVRPPRRAGVAAWINRTRALAVAGVVSLLLAGVIWATMSGPDLRTVSVAEGRVALDVPTSWQDTEETRWLDGPPAPDEVTVGEFLTVAPDVDQAHAQFLQVPGAFVRFSDGALVEWLEVGPTRMEREAALETYVVEGINRTLGDCGEVTVSQSRENDFFMLRQDTLCGDYAFAEVAVMSYESADTVIVDVTAKGRDLVDRIFSSLQLDGEPLVVTGEPRAQLSPESTQP